MHIDARTLPNDSLLEGDRCIVGAGAAGISMALEWIGSRHKVLLLEGGGLEYEPAMQELYRGESVGLPYYPLQAARLHLFGGTTGHWAGFCSTLDPIDFEKREWVPNSGWPIRREDLDPFSRVRSPCSSWGPTNTGRRIGNGATLRWSRWRWIRACCGRRCGSSARPRGLGPDIATPFSERPACTYTRTPTSAKSRRTSR